MKNLLFLLLCIPLVSFGQETLLNDYSKNQNGQYDKSNKYEELYISTYTKTNDGVAYDGVLIKNKKGYASSVRPIIYIPIEHISEFHLFLENGRDKYLKWETTRVANNIEEMKKSIDVFPHKLPMEGDDYGYFSGMTDVELIYDAKGGKSTMILKAYLSNGTRSQLFYPYLISNDGPWRDLALLRLINDLSVENIQAEIDAINNKALLFD